MELWTSKGSPPYMISRVSRFSYSWCSTASRICCSSDDTLGPAFSASSQKNKITQADFLSTWASWGEASSSDSISPGEIHPGIRAALSAGNKSIFAQYVHRLNTVTAHCVKKKRIKICSATERMILDKVNEVSGGRLLTAVLHVPDSVRKQCFPNLSLRRPSLPNDKCWWFVYHMCVLSYYLFSVR